MPEVTGHFLELNGAPHLVLTDVPHSLQAKWKAQQGDDLAVMNLASGALPDPRTPQAQTLIKANRAAFKRGHQRPTENPSADSPEEQLNVDHEMPVPQMGFWAVHSAEGVQNLDGFLYPLNALGENGQKLALEQVERALQRPSQHGAHMIRFDDQGVLLNWAITPKSLQQPRR